LISGVYYRDKKVVSDSTVRFSCAACNNVELTPTINMVGTRKNAKPIALKWL
jgi:hypothetical protein